MAVTDYLDRGTLVNPDGVCVVAGDVRLTYRELSVLVNRVANGLLAAGLGSGRSVAVLCDNEPRGYACTLGVMRSGAAYVPLDFRNSADDNARSLEFGDCEALFFGRRFQAQVEELAERLPRLELLVCLEEPVGAARGLDEWLAGQPDTPPAVEVPIEATAWLQTGSGTSGDFRMAMISHRAYHAFVANQLIWLASPPPVMLVAAPISHAGGGLSYHVLATGGRLVLLERADPEAVLRAIEEHGITEVFLPPTVIYRLLAHPDVRSFDTSSLRYLVYSAAPMSVPRLREALGVFGPVLAQGYGQTECLGIACMRPEELYVGGDTAGEVADDFRLAAAGRPSLPFCRLAILDDEGRSLPQGELGEVCVRGDQVMSGYYKNPEATEKTIVGGWLHTGDVGFVDDDGYVHLVDRKRDLVISGGFNVYPSEVEHAIASLDAVAESAVIGVPDDDWGEAVKAVVELRPGVSLTEAEVIARCKERLGSVKAPKSVDFVGELPRSQRGKILKRVLREPYWEGRTRRV